MPRLASLYLPYLSTDRVRRKRDGRREEGQGSRAPLTSPLDREAKEAREPCSCLRGSHWRPGARWARSSSPERGGGPPAKPVVEGAQRLSSGDAGPLHHAAHGPPHSDPKGVAHREELPLLLSHRVGNRPEIA